MSYKFSRGSQVIGDLKAEDDTERNTLIDFGEDQIDLQTSGTIRVNISNTGVYIPDPGSDFALTVSGNVVIGDGGDLTFQKGASDIAFIKFKEGTDGTSYNGYLGYSAAEDIYISAGRGADFFVQSRTTDPADPENFPFTIMDDGTARFEKGQTSVAVRAADLAPDIAFYVSGTTDGNNNAVFAGNVVMSGSLKVGDAFTFPTSDGTANQILETNGSGQLSWVDPVSGSGGGVSSPLVLMAHMSSDFNVQLVKQMRF